MIAKSRFGRTEHMSTRTIFGGAALYEGTPEKADRCLDLLLEYGVNHIDTAADYGEAEAWIGRWMGKYRKQFFLATKTSSRDYQGAKESIHRSLDHLRVDHLDLLQLHCLINPEEWEQALNDGGALEAAVEARENELIRFIGVTAHDVEAPEMLLKSLERFEFDTILLPYSYTMIQLPEYAEVFERLLAACESRDVAIQTIKSIARRPKQEGTSTHTTWYEPLVDQTDIDKCVHWVLGCEQVFLNTAADVNLLPMVLDAAARHLPGERPLESEMEALIQWQGMERIFPIESADE